MSWSITEHFFQVFLMAAVLLCSQTLARFTQNKRMRHEAKRLRSALTISLSALSEHYRKNLDLLSDSELTLISGRHQISLMRIQLGRITSLDEPEVEAVMAACTATERAEIGMEIAGKKMGSVAVVITAKGSARSTLISTLRETCDSLNAAINVLGSRVDFCKAGDVGQSPVEPVQPGKEESLAAM
jgi:cytochrome c biogenesis factor